MYKSYNINVNHKVLRTIPDQLTSVKLGLTSQLLSLDHGQKCPAHSQKRPAHKFYLISKELSTHHSIHKYCHRFFSIMERTVHFVIQSTCNLDSMIKSSPFLVHVNNIFRMRYIGGQKSLSYGFVYTGIGKSHDPSRPSVVIWWGVKKVHQSHVLSHLSGWLSYDMCTEMLLADTELSRQEPWDF